MFLKKSNSNSNTKNRAVSTMSALMLSGAVIMSAVTLSSCGRAPVTLNAKTFILEQAMSLQSVWSIPILLIITQ